MLLIKELENIALRGVVILTTSGVVRSVEDRKSIRPRFALLDGQNSSRQAFRFN